MTPHTDDELTAFVREQTRLAPVPLVPELSVYTASAVTPLWFATAQWLEDHDADVPFWSVPWAGGQALARYLLDHPETVRGKRVVDFACGGGLVGIAAARAGAIVRAVDIDPLAAVATRLNAAANEVHLTIETADLVGGALAGVDVLVAGDVWYEPGPSARFRQWFRAVAATGVRVLSGDPGRLHVPRRVRELARYQVTTPLELESVTERTARVIELLP
jgi:predicted nicotinamide N-methyase